VVEREKCGIVPSWDRLNEFHQYVRSIRSGPASPLSLSIKSKKWPSFAQLGPRCNPAIRTTIVGLVFHRAQSPQPLCRAGVGQQCKCVIPMAGKHEPRHKGFQQFRARMVFTSYPPMVRRRIGQGCQGRNGRRLCPQRMPSQDGSRILYPSVGPYSHWCLAWWLSKAWFQEVDHRICWEIHELSTGVDVRIAPPDSRRQVIFARNIRPRPSCSKKPAMVQRAILRSLSPVLFETATIIDQHRRRFGVQCIAPLRKDRIQRHQAIFKPPAVNGRTKACMFGLTNGTSQFLKQCGEVGNWA